MRWMRPIAVCVLSLLAVQREAARAQELDERIRPLDLEETDSQHERGDSVRVSERSDVPEAFGTITLGAGAA